jgi:hypothetical protein
VREWIRDGSSCSFLRHWSLVFLHEERRIEWKYYIYSTGSHRVVVDIIMLKAEISNKRTFRFLSFSIVFLVFFLCNKNDLDFFGCMCEKPT